MQRPSIRSHLLLLVLAMALALVGIAATHIYLDFAKSISHTKQSLRTLASTMVRNTGGTIHNAQQSLERLAQRPQLRALDSRQCDTALSDWLAMSPNYANVATANLQGEVICSAVPLPAGRSINVSQTNWFKTFSKSRAALIGLPQMGLISGKWVLVIAAPLRDSQGQVNGALYLPLDLNKFDPNIPDQDLPTGSRYGFFAPDGTLVWRNLDPEGVIGVKPNAEAARRIVATRDGEVEDLAVDGVRRYFSVVSMPDTGWVAFVGVPADMVYAEAREHARASAALTLLGLLGLAALATALARRITGPISKLEAVTRAIQHGDLNARADPHAPREIAQVAEAFNAMTERIQASTRQLQAEINERKEAEAQVQQMACRDPLTQLPNRRLLSERMSQLLAASRRGGHYNALMFLDLDNFKPINDLHGHAAGDLLLIEAATRLTHSLRETDTVARFGGDEFVLLIAELGQEPQAAGAQAQLIAEKVQAQLSAPYKLTLLREGQPTSHIEHHCSASIGVALFGPYDSNAEDALKWADTAMYQAKQAGRNRICFHDRREPQAKPTLAPPSPAPSDQAAAV